MIPIKIECGCGQHYAFDVEPVNGRMPSVVACPACGTDGTGAANDIIARHLPAQPAASPIRLIESPNPVRLAVATPAAPSAPATPAVALAVPASARPSAATVTRRDPRFGIVDRSQAEHEARAKVMWGDSQQEVIQYLMMQGFSVPEASELVGTMFQERAKTIRANGIRKVIIGTGLICVPLIALVFFLSIGIIPMKIFALTIMVGLYGLWLFVNGLLMAIAPKSERGDINDK